MEYVTLGFAVIGVALLIALLAAGSSGSKKTREDVRELKNELYTVMKEQDRAQGEMIYRMGEQTSKRVESMSAVLLDLVRQSDGRQAETLKLMQSELDNMRRTLERGIMGMAQENAKKLDEMRQVVDEKLQTTLDARITQSFKIVSERLEQVYRGLGEMQTIAAGVGDLKKVLSNVKSRGVLGEVQLGALLEQMLSPEQYVQNAMTKRGSQAFVEYAIKLPGDEDAPVYLPVDAKFPADAYMTLSDAYDSGEQARIERAGAELEARIKRFAKDIHDRYIDPPGTTDFAVMFLPFEGLYAEVVRRGLIETLQRDYKVNIAGPTTMAAFLNSLLMGFRTLAIQKRSGEVWSVLAEVRTEFDKFEDVLTAAKRRIDQTSDELDKLVGVRTRQIKRRLRDVSALPEPEAPEIAEGE